jgi:hypothetical protein
VFECRPPQCNSDADCTRDRCGRCLPTRIPVHSGTLVLSQVHVCNYEGTCLTGSCTQCSPARSYSDSDGNWHLCGGV